MMNSSFPPTGVRTPDPDRRLPDKAGQTTPENPWPLALLARKMHDYVERMPPLWIEAELIDYKARPGTRMSFFTVKDPNADVSMNITAFAGVVDQAGSSFIPGARLILHVKPNFWETRGTLSLRAAKVLVEGAGDLLARIEQLRKQLATEGLFSRERKRPIPFIPQLIGLVCGRNAMAKEDVLVNALARWPSARFEIREVAVQGEYAVAEVTRALQELDAHPQVDVIVITRGGGSVEDLLPFSDEHLVRAVAAAHTPVVSAIGHEEDAPLLDFVADVRASTPTDAARKIVPDRTELARELGEVTSRLRGAITRRLQNEWDLLHGLINRPVLTSPTATLAQQQASISADLVRMSAAVSRKLAVEQSSLSGLAASLSALSPQGTLARGYTILRSPSGQIVRTTDDLARGDLLEGVLAQGTFVVSVVGVNPGGSAAQLEGSEN